MKKTLDNIVRNFTIPFFLGTSMLLPSIYRSEEGIDHKVTYSEERTIQAEFGGEKAERKSNRFIEDSISPLMTRYGAYYGEDKITYGKSIDSNFSRTENTAERAYKANEISEGPIILIHPYEIQVTNTKQKGVFYNPRKDEIETEELVDIDEAPWARFSLGVGEESIKKATDLAVAKITGGYSEIAKQKLEMFSNFESRLTGKTKREIPSAGEMVLSEGKKTAEKSRKNKYEEITQELGEVGYTYTEIPLRVRKKLGGNPFAKTYEIKLSKGVEDLPVFLWDPAKFESSYTKNNMPQKFQANDKGIDGLIFTINPQVEIETSHGNKPKLRRGTIFPDLPNKAIFPEKGLERVAGLGGEAGIQPEIEAKDTAAFNKNGEVCFIYHKDLNQGDTLKFGIREKKGNNEKIITETIKNLNLGEVRINNELKRTKWIKIPERYKSPGGTIKLDGGGERWYLFSLKKAISNPQ